MGFLNKIFGSNKVRVEFIDASNGNTIGVSDMPPEQLPETFEIQTTMHLKDEDWSIEEATPVHSKDFLQTGKLTLKLRKVQYMNPKDILFSLPTISNEIPQLVNSNPFNDFEYSILEDDWRQSEFLNRSSLPYIEIEMEKIQKVKLNDSEEVDSEFTAFKSCHVRDTIGEPNLELDLVRLKDILKTEEIGCLKIADQYVENGFALKTNSTTFYGTSENGKVSQFCVGQFSEETSSEIQKITNGFGLLFIGWYRCQLIEPDA